MNVSSDFYDTEIFSSPGESSSEDFGDADLPNDVLPFYQEFRQRLIEGFFQAFAVPSVSANSSSYHCTDEESASQQTCSHANTAPPSSNPLPALQGHQGKRKRSYGREEEDNDDNQVPHARFPNPLPDVNDRRLFACPYFKFNPARFSEMNRSEKDYRGCSTKYLTDISRLK